MIGPVAELRPPHRQAVAVVDGGQDDHVRHSRLVLDQQEHDPLRGRRALAGDEHPGDGDRRSIRNPLEVLAGDGATEPNEQHWRQVGE